MKSISIAGLLLCSLAALVYYFTTPTSGDSARKLMPVSSLQLGEVFSNSPRPFTISLKNIASQPVSVTAISTSCNCASVTAQFETLAPDEVGNLEGSLELGNLMVKGGDANPDAVKPKAMVASITLTCEGGGETWHEVIPLDYDAVNYYAVGNWQVGETLPPINVEQGVSKLPLEVRTFVIETAKPIRDSKVISSGPLEVRSRRLTDHRFEVEVCGIKEDAELGPYVLEISFSGTGTEGNELPPGAFSIYGELVCDVKLLPSIILFDDEKTKETVTLVSSASDGFTIIEITAPDGCRVNGPALPAEVKDSIDLELSQTGTPIQDDKVQFLEIVILTNGEKKPRRLKSTIQKFD